MTPDELHASYQAANWLIAKRSTAAAGKALIFTAGSFRDATNEIAAIYGLNDEESSRLVPANADTALASVQTAANSLFGETLGMSTAQAMSAAKMAMTSGQHFKAMHALMRAGPKAATAIVAGGKVAGKTAGKTTPWGWIATAVYAAGVGSWFAYNLRSFNLAAFELVRLRENMQLPPRSQYGPDMISKNMLQPALATISGGASAIGRQAGAVWSGAVEKGGQFAGATGEFTEKIAAKWKEKP